MLKVFNNSETHLCTQIKVFLICETHFMTINKLSLIVITTQNNLKYNLFYISTLEDV